MGVLWRERGVGRRSFFGLHRRQRSPRPREKFENRSLGDPTSWVCVVMQPTVGRFPACSPRFRVFRNSQAVTKGFCFGSIQSAYPRILSDKRRRRGEAIGVYANLYR